MKCYSEAIDKSRVAHQDYEAGTYQSMTLEGKMDFFDGVHTNHIPLFDEDGNDLDS